MAFAGQYSALFQLARLSDHALQTLLDALTEIDCEQLWDFPNIPLLYYSGVRYYHDNTDDPWLDVLSILMETQAAKARGRRAVIDCEDLACWRAAELRVRFGVRTARAVFTRKIAVFPDGRRKQLVHIFVGGLPGGQFEDPSRILGMNLSLGQGIRIV